MPVGSESPPAPGKDRLQVGDWTVEPALNQVSAAGKTVKLEPKAMAVLVYLADRPGQVDRHIGSTDKAERLLGWKARTSFEDGLERTIDWYRENEAWWRAPQRRPASVFSS